MSNFTSPFDLTGRRILISGAAGGIGSATAQLCAQQGAQLVLIDIAPVEHIREQVGEETAKNAEIYSVDVGSREAVAQLADRVGSVYGLIDAAGVCPVDDWLADDWEDALDMVLRVNVKGPLNLTRAFFPSMVSRNEGRIVLCGSVAGWMGGLRSGPHYAFSKGGVHAFVRWLARRGAPHNVLVNGIAPGPVETAMTAHAGYDKNLYPLKRMGKPAELASMAVLLCSAAGGYATGAIFDINGATHYR